MPAGSATWISIPLALVMFGYLIYVLRKGQRIEFFPTYSELGKAYPRPDYIFRAGNELHGYFMSGEGLISWEGNKNVRFFKRIILPHPSGSYLRKLKACILLQIHICELRIR